jgi:hypothetical protein
LERREGERLFVGKRAPSSEKESRKGQGVKKKEGLLTSVYRKSEKQG